MLEIRTLLDELLKPWKQRLRHDQAFRAAVGQHEAIVVFGQKRVDGHCDDAGLQAAEKRRRPIDGIKQRDQHAFFAFDPKPAQRSAKTRHTVCELAISVRAARIDIGRLVGTTRARFAARTSAAKL